MPNGDDFMHRQQPKNKPVITLGNGVNTYTPPFFIQDDELTDEKNLCSDFAPALSVRPDRAMFATPSTKRINGIGVRDSSTLVRVNGIDWQYWNVATTAWVSISTAVNSTVATLLDMSFGSTFKSFLFNSTAEPLEWGGAGASSSLGASAPKTRFVTGHRNRIYGLKNKRIHFSGLGASTDWTSSNAGGIDITNAIGDGTAIIAFGLGDGVMCFTKQTMHLLKGTGLFDFSVVDISQSVGCVNHDSLKNLGKVPIWLDYSGVYIYDGILELKSKPVQKWINGINWTYESLICAGVKENKYYLSIPYGSTANNVTLVYDSEKDNWHVEDGNFLQYATVGRKLYAIAGSSHSTASTSGDIWDMDDGTYDGDDEGTPIDWNGITKVFNENAIDAVKNVLELDMVYKSSGTLEVDYTTQFDSTASTDFSSVADSSDLTLDGGVYSTDLLIPSTDLDNVDFYRLKFSGTGYASIYYLQRNVEYGSDL
jgi:hypothetical protein